MSRARATVSSVGDLLAVNANHRPDATFVITDKGATTYGQFYDGVLRVAGSLVDRGVGRGDRVAIALDNSEDFLTVSFAVATIGAIQVPLDLAYQDRQIDYVLRDADVILLICDADFHADHHKAFSQVASERTVLRGTDPGSGVLTLDHLRSGRRHLPESNAVDGSDPYAILYTSGTTGEPKGVLVCHNQELVLSRNIAMSAKMSEDDCFYNSYPLHHNTGLGIITLSVLQAGARMALVGRFTLSGFWSDIERFGCTVFYGMGPVLELLLKSEATAPPRGASTLRVCWAIAVTSAQVDRFRERFDIDFITGYGSTEVNMVAIGDFDELPTGAAGRVLSEFQLAVVNDHDQELPLGEAGEIVIRPRTPFTTALRYWRKEAQTLSAWRNLWIHTGDIGWLDSEGHVYFVDRKTDVIRHRGYNVSSAEIEGVVLALPGVADAAAVPVPSGLGDFDQDICVVVEREPGTSVSAESIIDACRDNLATHAVPQSVVFMDELPRTSTGKVRKRDLRKQLEIARQDHERESDVSRPR